MSATSNLHSPDNMSSSDRAARRRRLEADMMIAQADRAKLLRQLETLDIERRAIKNDIDRRTETLSFIDDQFSRCQGDLQRIDNDLARFRRQINSL